MRLKDCILSPPSLLQVPGRGKEARKRNLSIASNPVSVRIFVIHCTDNCNLTSPSIVHYISAVLHVSMYTHLDASLDLEGWLMVAKKKFKT